MANAGDGVPPDSPGEDVDGRSAFGLEVAIAGLTAVTRSSSLVNPGELEPPWFFGGVFFLFISSYRFSA